MQSTAKGITESNEMYRLESLRNAYGVESADGLDHWKAYNTRWILGREKR